VIVYPNPSRSKFTFGFELKKPGNVILQVFDLRGQIVNETRRNYPFSGINKLILSADSINNQTTGIYIYRLILPDITFTGKLILEEY